MDFEIITLNKRNISDFAKERNELLKKASKKWVLFLDSDEKISNRDLAISDKFFGYYLKRKNYFLGRYIGSDLIIRLAKKGSGVWSRRVHEKWNVKGRIGKMNGVCIIHNTADNLRDYINKINYYSTLHAEANKSEGKRPSLFKIFFYPGLKFTLTLIKSGNVVFSIMQALHSFLSWSKLYFLRS